VFPVHGVGGILGSLLVAVFASTDLGLFSGQGYLLETMPSMGAQFQAQLIGVVAVTLFTALMTYLILKFVGLFLALRVSSDEETQGLDIAAHEERGYDL
jgi:Amt family ammonium transporter